MRRQFWTPSFDDCEDEGMEEFGGYLSFPGACLFPELDSSFNTGDDALGKFYATRMHLWNEGLCKDQCDYRERCVAFEWFPGD